MIAFSLAFLVAAQSITAEAAPVPALTTPLSGPFRVRVRLAESVSSASVRGFDLRFHDGQGRKLASPDRKSEWEFRCAAGQVSATSTSGAKLSFGTNASVTSPTGFLSYKGNPYREEFKISAVASGCEVVNVVDLEEYLDGLVNSEFSAKWSEEAIAAQVVAARTYAVHQIQHARLKKDSRFDLDATVKDQVYDGSIREDFRASRTVDRTRGLVLATGAKGKVNPVKAFYHSTCGGRTEMPENVWGTREPGFRRKVECPFCKASPRFEWTLELKPDEIRRKIIEGSKGAPKRLEKATLHAMSLEQVAGRVTQVMTTWKDAQGEFSHPVPGAQFRNWIGPGRLRSTVFQVALDSGGSWKFQGRGNGHGVGMCQWGAKVMAEKGSTVTAILKHYYPDAVLRKLW